MVGRFRSAAPGPRLAAALLALLAAGSRGAPGPQAPSEGRDPGGRVTLVEDASGVRLRVEGRDFMINGINWDYFPRGTNYEYSLWSQPRDVIQAALDREMSLLREMGVNAIRQYPGITPEWVRYIHETYGIFTILNPPVGRWGVTLDGVYHPVTDYSDPAAREALVAEVSELVRAFRDTPGILMWLLANENNYGLVWSSPEIEDLPDELRDPARARWLYRTLGRAAAAVKELDPSRPVAIANGDLQYLDLIAQEMPALDVFGTNIYRGPTFAGAYEEVRETLGLPVLLTEFGADAYNAREGAEDQESQARFLRSQWREIYSHAAGMGGAGNAIGGLTFQWSDGWWKLGGDVNLDVHDTAATWHNAAYYDYEPGKNNMNEEWWGVVAKGLPDEHGHFELFPRAAYFTLRQVHRYDPYGPDASPESLDAHLSAIDPARGAARRPTKARVVQTSRGGDRLAEIATLELVEASGSEKPVFTLDPEASFQTILGFGGSFTEATAYVLGQLPAEKRDEVIRAYFGPGGAAYTLTRTHINSSDFSLGNYAYAEVPGDTRLEHFSIEEDLDDIVPLIRDAMAVSEAGFRIIASPWTAPPWMKDNNDWNDGSLKPELYPTWALYFSKYIRAYREQGIDIWGVTIENEPLGNGGQWESMIFTPQSMADFLKNHLGPRFEQDGIDAKILVYDQNRDHLEEWADVILGDPEAARYAWGVAVHWYSSTVDWYPEALSAVHERYPDKPIVHTEGTIDAEVPVWRDDDWYWRPEATDWGYDWAPEHDKPKHPKYVPAFRYARDIIGGLNSWLVGWIDWNMVLDRQGGPNHAENWCIAPVIADPETGEVYYTPLYYVLAQFSRAIRPGAVRIGLDGGPKELMATALRNPDGRIVVALLNPTGSQVDYAVALDGRLVETSIAPSAVQTLTLE